MRKCWNCGYMEMEEVRKGVLQWWKCPECGATETDVPETGALGFGGTYKDAAGISHRSAHPVSHKKKAKK